MKPSAESTLDLSAYRAAEVLRDGRHAVIRALQPQDREALSEAFARTGDESRYRRFFTSKRSLSEGEIKFFVEVNFTTHVALVCELEEGGRKVIAGGGRYVVCAPGSAEVAFMVDDAHQGLGIGSLLMRHLVTCAQLEDLVRIRDREPDLVARHYLFKTPGRTRPNRRPRHARTRGGPPSTGS